MFCSLALAKRTKNLALNKALTFLFGKPPLEITLAKTANLTNCANCGAVLSWEYCAVCGQKKENGKDFSFVHFLRTTFHAFTNFDTKFFATFRKLVRSPGFLTLDYIQGHRKKYVGPLQLFLICNLVYFLFPMFDTFTTPLKFQVSRKSAANMVANKVKDLGVTYQTYESAFNAEEKSDAKTLVIIMIPFFAMLISVLFLKQRRYFLEFIVFSFHFFSFFLLFSIIGLRLFYILMKGIGWAISFLGAKQWALELQRFFGTDNGITIVILAIFFVYLFIAIRRVFSQSRFEAFFKSLVSIVFLATTVVLYRDALFFTAFYTLRLPVN